MEPQNNNPAQPTNNNSPAVPKPTWNVSPQNSSSTPVADGFSSSAPAPVSTAGMPASVQPASLPNGGAFGVTTPQVVMGATRPKKKRFIIASVIAGVIVLVGGGSAAAYYGYILPNKPQNLLNAALVNQFTPDKITATGFHGAFTAKGDSAMSVSGTFKGAVDKQGPFDISGDVDALVTKITYDVRSVDGKDYYVRLGGLNGLDKLLAGSGDTSQESIASIYAPLISTVNNQWFLINQSLISQFQPDMDVSKGLKLSDTDIQKLTDIYKKHQFLAVQQKLKDEKIGSHASYHLKIVVDKTEIKAFATDLKAANVGSLKITNDQLKAFNKSADSANFSKYPVDVWVSKSQKFIDQISFTTKDGSDEFTATATVDSWNETVKVTKPADAKSLLELLGQAYGGSGAGVESLFNSQEGSGSGNGISL